MVLFTAKHSDSEEALVIYKGLNNGKYYARPIQSFTELVKDENGKQVLRFSLANKEDVENLFNNETYQIYNAFCK